MDSPLYSLILRTITTPMLQPGQSFDIEEPHNYFFLETGTDVKLLFNAKPPECDIPRGVGYQYPIDQSVQRLRIVNGSASPQALTFLYGRGNIIDSRLTFSGAAVQTIMKGAPTFNSLADVALPATATTQIAAVNANRASLVVVPLTAGVILRIGDSGASATNGTPLTQYQPLVLDTQDAVYAYNPSGAAASVSVSETVVI